MLFEIPLLRVNLEIIIWAVCIGINVAFILTFIIKNFVGECVRSIIKNAQGEENAKTLSELKSMTPICRYFLRDGKTLRNIISVVGNELPKKSVKGVLEPDFDSAKFYIKQENVKKAEGLYGKVFKWYHLLIFALSSVLIALFAIWIIPLIISI